MQFNDITLIKESDLSEGDTVRIVGLSNSSIYVYVYASVR